MDGEDGVRTRSFRYEDYNYRRAFLQSYPLHWGKDEENNEETVTVTEGSSTGKKHMKKIILSVCDWSGEKLLILRRFKDRFTDYVIACISIRFKSPTALISV
ncbi:hypothetical protein HRI_000752000 [Hibiscus trionum]|uniref:Uncharacterized protein n=1 Tax=Hibiscus trionum TaxID=183268 RepID=A0A9W7H547_HIBTR|nr:hypothetical protein HRI_000752000 [Hibiscus trionum]